MSKEFDLIKALKNINLEVNDFLTLFGPNGAGKTTLIKTLATLMKPTSGTAKINDIDIIKNPVKARKNLGVISHKTYLYDGLTAEENLLFYGKLFDVQEIEKKKEELIKKVGLEYRKKDRISNYSRGMRQRLSIARALIHNPSVLLLDEPYAGLDQKASKILEETLNKLKDKTIILTTHNLDRGFKLCKKLAIIVNGEIIYKNNQKNLKKEEFKKIYHKSV